MTSWDPVRMKAQLRLTAQRLGQLQDKLESQAQITRRDIATLLQEGNVLLARAKTRKLIKEDNRSDLLQTLEMHVGVVLGHLSEFERSDPPSPVVIEATSSIIYAAPNVDSRELLLVKDLLMQQLGPDFARSASENRDGYVSARVVRILSALPPSASRLDQYMYNIAKNYNVDWVPDLPAPEKINALSVVLDQSSTPLIDIGRLRALCSQGLPEEPPWLRPKVWKLLLNSLPLEKSAWMEHASSQRENYYDLIRRLLEPFSSLPTPTSPLEPLDASLLNISRDLAQVPSQLLSRLEEAPEESRSCPLDDSAPEDIKITCARNLDLRLQEIRSSEAQASTSDGAVPEIRLESTPEIRFEGVLDDTSEQSQDRLDAPGISTPEISLSAPDSPSSSQSVLPTTLLPSRPYGMADAHQKHVTALLRLLYVHSYLNPANRLPHIASLLVPLYSALVEEVDPQDTPHVEADTFWLFETIIGEFAELEDMESGSGWIRKLGDRLRWADEELADSLQTKGLDPALPHYSVRWLLPILTHTLPLSAVLMVWDSLFSRPMRERNENPKLEYLLDVCTSMLLCARGILIRLGRPGRKVPDLWTDESAAIPSSSLGARELDDAFAEGMSFLQQYPLKAVGGMESVLQTAHDLAFQRESDNRNASREGTSGIGARLRQTFWNSLSYQSSEHTASTEDDSTDEYVSDEEIQEGAIENGQSSTLTARLANTVWRGITNRSAMEDSPSPASSAANSPVLASSPLPSPPLSQPHPQSESTSKPRSSIWGYTEKLKESNAAATLSKVSTNWRVKALDVWNKRGNVSLTASSSLSPPLNAAQAESHRRASLSEFVPKTGDDKRSSLPLMDRKDAYEPPPRPAFFRPVRDSIIPLRVPIISPMNGEASPISDTGSATSTHSARSSLAMPDSGKSLRSGPRPLLLNSSSLITSPHSRSPSSTTTSASTDHRWADMVRDKRPAVTHRSSQSSISSVSPSDVPIRPRRADTRAEVESDSTSRIVPIRSTPSPMARASRRTASTTFSPITSPSNTAYRRLPTEAYRQHGSDDSQGSRGWSRIDVPTDSPGSPVHPSPPPETPDTQSSFDQDVLVRTADTQRGSLLDGKADDAQSPQSVQIPKLLRRTAALTRLQMDEDTSDSSAAQAPERSPRAKPRRHVPRLNNIRDRDVAKASTTEFPSGGLPSLVPEWPEDNVTTPRAMSFDAATGSAQPVSPRSRRVRKTSGEGNGVARTRKISGESQRSRKISGDGTPRISRKTSSERDESKHKRESAAVDGDDEGYNDLLSAYESEDNDV
ncbi:hypothetical protein CERSUDRAFT_113595 [Gelatoporia subvermispora B]|uniref:Rab-GAP TBC domain-containing protein n=1 Tax=Ceriporiopsis subvermispora (strain B) TaxID=914234 RepID=M2QN55_CERS8|nr:hypothetical protein CERSUDRAFT_113595 [Gelatoporia subvermispora B]